MSSRKWAITAARVTMSASFVGSDGCSWKDPRSNHAWVPLRLDPRPDTTRASIPTQAR